MLRLLSALYRAVKASLSLNLLSEANSYCNKALEQSPDSEELKKLAKQIDQRKSEHERQEAKVSKAVAAAKNLVTALEDRKLKMGKAMYQELTGLKRPFLDKDNILHWPVLFLYAEAMSSDIVEDFCETDMFSMHLDTMFSEDCPPLPWDTKHAYTRDAVELYYEAGSGVCLSKTEIFRSFLEGTAASHLEKFGSEENDAADRPTNGILAGDNQKWVKVNERRRLYDVLKEPNFVVTGIPVLFVVSKKSSFYTEFTSGNWAPPGLA